MPNFIDPLRSFKRRAKSLLSLRSNQSSTLDIPTASERPRSAVPPGTTNTTTSNTTLQSSTSPIQQTPSAPVITPQPTLQEPLGSTDPVQRVSGASVVSLVTPHSDPSFLTRPNPSSQPTPSSTASQEELVSTLWNEAVENWAQRIENISRHLAITNSARWSDLLKKPRRKETSLKRSNGNALAMPITSYFSWINLQKSAMSWWSRVPALWLCHGLVFDSFCRQAIIDFQISTRVVDSFSLVGPFE